MLLCDGAAFSRTVAGSGCSGWHPVRVDYPSEAYAPNGVLWWRLTSSPDSARPFGDERKIASYLACTKVVGDTFTTRELREAVGGDGEANSNEHFQRRLRALRSKRDGWQIASFQDDRTLPAEHYRIDQIGWHPGLGPRPKNIQVVSAKTRGLVLRRDGSRCQVCGVGDNEPYPEDSSRLAVMTVGHLISQDFGGSNDLSNLRTEYALCNEQMRSEGGKPESFEEVWSAVRKLTTPQVKRLDGWLAQGYRSRDTLDETYDRVRKLSPGDLERMATQIAAMRGRDV